MKQSTFRRYAKLGQLGLLLIFLLINFVENIGYYSVFESFVYALNYTFMVAAVVYFHYIYVLPIYLKGNRWVYFITVFLLMTFFIILYYIIDTILPFEYNEDDDGLTWGSAAYDYLILILTTAYTSLYYFVELWFKNITKESQLKNEKLQAELNFLKSQINPHFLFNTLNNIYSYAQTGNEKTAPMLERLSSILRFMVYDCGENRVGLSKEITAIEDLLEIHKMKNSEQRNIKLSLEGVKRYHLIAPLIIVNFVENACKHSDAVSNPEGFIHVRISVDEKDICLCEISNSIKKINKENKYGGVGLENIKKRLTLQYGDSYLLEETKKKWAVFFKIADSIGTKKIKT